MALSTQSPHLSTSQDQSYLSPAAAHSRPALSLAPFNMSRDKSKDRPALQFLTRSHPDDFKDETARANVRSHVMRDYRRKNSPANSGKRPARSRSKAGQASSDPPARPTLSRGTSFTRAESMSPTDPVFTIPSSRPSNAEWGEDDSLLGGISCYHFDRPRVELCASDDDAGPFHLPTFVEPSLRFAKLCFNCLAMLASTRDFSQNPGASLSPPSRERITLLASLTSETARRDLIMNREGAKSQACLDFHAYTLRLLNDNLGDPEKAVHDETIIGIFYLYMAEVMAVSCVGLALIK